MTISMSLIKLPFIVADALWMRITATPPNPPRPLKEHIIPDWRERFLKSLALPSMYLRTTYWVSGIVEVAIILANTNPTGPVSRFIIRCLVSDPAAIQRIRVTPFFILGNIFTIYGTFLRVQSYRALGKLFSFELCIHNDHVLINHGPYAIVRHPSYTGLILTLIGAYANNISGSWVRECGLLDTSYGRVLAVSWVAVAFAVVMSLLLRIPREDAILRAKFGDEWVSWAQQVPYRLIPGVY